MSDSLSLYWSQDGSDRQAYDALSPAEMRVGLEVAEVGLGRVDYVADTVLLDQLAAALFGFPAGQPIGRADFHARIDPEDWPAVAAEVDQLLDADREDVIHLVHRIRRPDGTRRWVRARKRVWFDGRSRGSKPTYGVFAVVDITAQKEAELRSDYLLHELNHRSKNLITVISSIARQIQRHAPNEEALPRLLERLQVLARNQDAIVGTANGRFALAEVLDRQVDILDELRRERLVLDGPAVSISAEDAQVLAMIMHELITNSLKHGALSDETGRVTVRWEPRDEGGLAFHWVERDGPPVVKPTRSGFGTQVLTSFVRATFGAPAELDYAPDGFVFELTIPADRITR